MKLYGKHVLFLKLNRFPSVTRQLSTIIIIAVSITIYSIHLFLGAIDDLQSVHQVPLLLFKFPDVTLNCAMNRVLHDIYAPSQTIRHLFNLKTR